MGRFIPCVLVVNDEPKARRRANGYWFRLMFPTAWPSTSGEVSILRSPENLVEPLRGVGEPSEVMLKLMAAELECRVDGIDPRAAEIFGLYDGDSWIRKQLKSNLRLFCNVQIRCRTEARCISFGDVYGQG